MAIDPALLALHRCAIRLTPVRRAVLNLLWQSPCALSGGELEKQLGLVFDRITLYRTLCTFEKKGLIHRVIDYCETVRYAVSSPEPGAAPHVHFKCTACQRLYCLHQVAVPVVELPAPLLATARDYLYSGLCAQCQPV